RSAAAATRAARWRASATSPGMATSLANGASSSATACRASALRASSTRLQPRPARPLASASPSPLDAPVTMATPMPAPYAREILFTSCFCRKEPGYAAAMGLVAACEWRVDAALVLALQERYGDPVDAYVNGSQVWLREDGPGGI